jgi:MFS family permease
MDRPAGPLPPASEAPSRLPGFLAPFGHTAFRRLWTGAFLSSLGTWTQDVALAWLIHTTLREPIYLGLRAFAADAPLLAFMLVGGANADRRDRRQILLISQVVQMSCAAALLVLYSLGRLGIFPILALAALTGLAQSQSAPTYQAVITSLVPARQIPNAVALNSLQFNLSRAIGPAIAGLLLARGGTDVCFAVNVVSFFAVMVALLRIELPAPAQRRSESMADSLRAGLRYVGQDRLLAVLTGLGAAGSLLGFPLTTYLPAIASERLAGDAAVYSHLLSSLGVGAIVGALATAQRGNAPGRGRLALLAFAVYGLSTAAAVASRTEVLSAALLFVSGASLVTGFSTINSLVQENSPEALKGRVLAIYGLAFRGGMPIGSLLAGLLAGSFGAAAVIGVFSLLMVVLAGLARRAPGLARV